MYFCLLLTSVFCHLCVLCLHHSTVFFPCTHWKLLNKVSLLSGPHHPHCKSQLLFVCVYVYAYFWRMTVCVWVSLCVWPCAYVVMQSVSHTVILWIFAYSSMWISHGALCKCVCMCLCMWKATHNSFEHASTYENLFATNTWPYVLNSGA